MLRLTWRICKKQQVMCNPFSGTGLKHQHNTGTLIPACSLWTSNLFNRASSEESNNLPSSNSTSKDVPEPVTAVERHSAPIPVIYHPETAVDKRIAKQEAKFDKKYDVQPTEVLVYDNGSRCRRLLWMFHGTSAVAIFTWLNSISFAFQKFTCYNEDHEVLGKIVEVVTLYKQFPPDFPFHTQVFIFAQSSLMALFFIMWAHLSLNRQIVRLYIDTDYGRFKGVLVEANQYNERTVEFSYKDVTPIDHPLPRIQNFAIKGLPYYIDEKDFKHPKYYAYFKGAFDEILDKNELNDREER